MFLKTDVSSDTLSKLRLVLMNQEHQHKQVPGKISDVFLVLTIPKQVLHWSTNPLSLFLCIFKVSSLNHVNMHFEDESSVVFAILIGLD